MPAALHGPDCAGPRFPLGDVLAAFVLVYGGAFMIGFATLMGG
ncbi:hypothetical protein [Enterovirga rhinocerotis]|uniref:Uncharacterized protein n=1 Tax=Enterovirga rhinocerotis TaxID=1339210 RepID=A0A4V3DXY0_9HYPH|nr:hypothetical protein [Enterovirga rhinocerotis]TDR90309.1 hypothetical protein EV668_3157 [Enterovirga rhinocerotis]